MTVGELLARGLPQKVVFVGGATTGLYLTDPAAPPVRPTSDVDVVVDVASYMEYSGPLREALKKLGAREDTAEGAPLCRWTLAGTTIDVMAPDERVLQFTNRWYSRVLENPRPHRLSDGTEILVTTGPLFLATKVEAFNGRGGGDFMSSEDIVIIFDGRSELVDEVKTAEPELRRFLKKAFAEWLEHPYFGYAVEGAVEDGRVDEVLERMRAIAELDLDSV